MPSSRVNHAAHAVASAAPNTLMSCIYSNELSALNGLSLSALFRFAVLRCAASRIAPTAAWRRLTRRRRSRRGQRQAADKAAADKTGAAAAARRGARCSSPSSSTARRCNYTVTVGALPVRDKDGKVAGEVVVTAYTVEGENRPVTFAFNGGPGASSVYLNFGAIGPKHMNAGNEGDSPSDPASADRQSRHLARLHRPRLHRSHRHRIQPRRRARGPGRRSSSTRTTPDIEYLSRVIYDWLVKNDRLGSRKYLVGESYGGFRGPRITHYLQSQLGVAMNGVVLVSPYLNPDHREQRRSVARCRG